MKSAHVTVNSPHPGGVEAVMSWNFTRVFQYLKERKKWTEGKCRKLDQEYRRYISLCVMHPNSHISPSPDVDEVWHTHILFTCDYRSFCDASRGSYIDHTPFLEADRRLADAKKSPSRTMKLYRQHFGEPDHRVWPWAKTIKAKGSDCSADCKASCGDCSSSDCGPRCT